MSSNPTTNSSYKLQNSSTQLNTQSSSIAKQSANQEVFQQVNPASLAHEFVKLTHTVVGANMQARRIEDDAAMTLKVLNTIVVYTR
jgi:hypothetical protein